LGESLFLKSGENNVPTPNPTKADITVMMALARIIIPIGSITPVALKARPIATPKMLAERIIFSDLFRFSASSLFK
jgi:hypothetical protein